MLRAPGGGGPEGAGAGRAEEAAALLREALGLWRGAPLADLAFEPFAQAEIARLEEQRLCALEARVEADLATGEHVALVGELRQLLVAHPARERLTGQLMVALYRSGRQSEALAAYRDARRALVEDAGIEPGPELQRLHGAVLDQDPSLELVAATTELPRELDPTGAPVLAGRDAELDLVARALGGGAARRGPAGHGVRRRGDGEEPAGGRARGRGALRRSRRSLRVRAGTAGCGPGRARRCGGGGGPTLLVLDDADRAGAEALGELPGGLARAPVLVVATGRDAAGLAHLGAGDALALGPLDATAVEDIAGSVADEAETIPTGRLLEASGGVPRRVHEVVGRWNRGGRGAPGGCGGGSDGGGAPGAALDGGRADRQRHPPAGGGGARRAGR